VNNFTGDGVVKSFYVPYFCPECDEEKVLLAETGDMGPPPHEPPTCRCDECDLVMDFDDMPDSYFAFLTNHIDLTEPERINEVLSEFNGDGEKSRIRSRVSGSASVGGSMSSLPNVPSLPSISRTGITGTGPGGSLAGLGTGSFSGVGSTPGIIATPSGTLPAGLTTAERPAMPQPKSSALVYVLVAFLLAVIGVLAYMLFAGS
ncbi:MAG: hypothetical protein AAGC55_11650, partial [Myxococcota bacterium]